MTALLPRRGLAQILALIVILAVDRVVSPQFFDLRLQDGRLFGSLIDVLNRGAPVTLLSLGMVLVIATRGIDVGAHAEIIRLIRELCDDGLSLLVISSELDEIVTYSDRVIVLRDRAHVEELSGEAIDVTNILSAIAADGAAMQEARA